MIKKVVIMGIFLNFLKSKYQEGRQNRKRHGLGHSITTILIEILQATSEWLEQQKRLLQQPVSCNSLLILEKMLIYFASAFRINWLRFASSSMVLQPSDG